MVEKFYTIEQVAEILQVHERTVRNMLKDGRIKGIKIGRMWRIPERSLEELARGEGKDWQRR